MANKGIGLESEVTTHLNGHTHLLVIAIDAYQHCPPLFNCVKDARDLIEVLTDRYWISREHVTTLFNEAATRDNIYRAFEKLTTSIKAPDNLLVYFSGHGEYNPNFRQGYWIPVEAERGRPSQYIPNSEIRIFLSAIPAHHIFLMSDSCFSGSLFSQGADRSVSKRYEADPSRWGLTSGRNEIVSDGKPGDNSPFAESLLYRLRQNTDSLSVQELCAHVVEYVQSNAQQSPIGEPLKVAGHKNGQFVFHVRKNEGKDWALVKEKGTLAAYQSYLSSYPQGKHRVEAEKKSRILQEEQEWKKVKAENSIFSYNRYLSTYTDGKYEEAARQALRRLEDDQSWQEARKQGTLSAMYDYLDRHPQGQYQEAARQQINALLEVQRPVPTEPASRKKEIAPKTAPTPKNNTTNPSSSSPSSLRTPLKAIGGTLALLLLFFIGKQLIQMGSGNPGNTTPPTVNDVQPSNNGAQDLTTDFINIGDQVQAEANSAEDRPPAPLPPVSLNGFRGYVNLKSIGSDPQIRIHCPESDCDCYVKGFWIKYLSAGKKSIQLYNSGSYLNPGTKQLLNGGKSGDIFYFGDLKIACGGEQEGRLVDDFSIRIGALAGLPFRPASFPVAVELPSISESTVTAEAFSRILVLSARQTDCSSNCPCEVETFTLTREPAAGLPVSMNNRGALFQSESLNLIRQATTGDHYYFTNIQVSCEAGILSNAQSLHFTIK